MTTPIHASTAAGPAVITMRVLHRGPVPRAVTRLRLFVQVIAVGVMAHALGFSAGLCWWAAASATHRSSTRVLLTTVLPATSATVSAATLAIATAALLAVWRTNTGHGWLTAAMRLACLHLGAAVTTTVLLWLTEPDDAVLGLLTVTFAATALSHLYWVHQDTNRYRAAATPTGPAA